MALNEAQVKALTGLTSANAAHALRTRGPNELPSAKKRGILGIVFEVVKEPMFLLLLACGLIYLVLGDIQEAMKGGHFRQDLYFRLNVVSIHVPPLSERKDDIPLLSYYFLKKYATLMKKELTEISQDVIVLLQNYDFPGNVRELQNIIERGVALSNENSIEMIHLPEDLRELSIKTFRKHEGKIPSLEEQEMAYIKWVLQEVGGNKTLAAQILGIDRVSLWRKMKKFGMEAE
jgi:transcriptional regulator with PAS, ATPase and Fis domain